MLAQEHGHQPRVLAELEALDLQVMLGDPDAGPAAGVTEARVLADLVEHPLVEHGILASHAALELVAAADRHVHEGVEVHAHPRGSVAGYDAPKRRATPTEWVERCQQRKS